MSLKVILGPDKGYIAINPVELKDENGFYQLPNSDMKIDELSYLLLQRPNRVFLAVEKDKKDNLYALYPLSLEEQKSLPDLKYEPVRKVGTGSFTTVVGYPTEGIGIKKYINDEPDLPKDLLKEIGIYRLLGDFVCIPYLYGFQMEPKLSIQLELGIGTLQSELKRLTERKKIMYKMCRCMQIISSQGIIHCDLKPQNIILTRSGSVQIIDWGISEIDRSKYEDREKSIHKQTIWYRAPELVIADTDTLPYNYKIDIFSLGCILFDMYNPKSPLFHGIANNYDYVRRTLTLINDDTEMGKQSFDKLKSYVQGSTISPKLKEKFMQQYKFPEDVSDLLSNMLEYNPNVRYDYSQILSHPYFEKDAWEEIQDFPYLICNSLIPFGVDMNAIWQKYGTSKRHRAFQSFYNLSKKLEQNVGVAVNSMQLLDFFVYKTPKVWSESSLECIGYACYSISSKILSGRRIVEYLDCNIETIGEMERTVLATLQGNILVPTLESIYSHDGKKQDIDFVKLYTRSDVYDLLAN